MDKEELILLITQFHQKRISDEALAKLKLFVSQQGAQQVLEDIDFPNVAKELTADTERIYEQIQKRISHKDINKISKLRLLWRIAAAACIIAVISFYYFQLNRTSRPVEWVNVSAAPGSIKKITLPDSSIVYLNAGSQLSYPKHNSDTSRVVRLLGEAYFEVVHDKTRPFLVKTNHTITRVLGTHFNIEAYQKENLTRVALVEGRVETGDSVNRIILTPGNMMIHDNLSGDQSQLSITGDITAWIRGELVFNNLPLEQALQRISQAYNTIIDMDKQLSKTEYSITGQFQKDELPRVLNALLVVHGLKWEKTQDNKYRVYL